MQDQYADLVDVHLTSHIHGDHTNYGLIKRLLDRGKTVVVSDDTKAVWRTTRPDVWDKVTTLLPDTDTTLHGLDVRRLGGPGKGLPLVESMRMIPTGLFNCSADVETITKHADGTFNMTYTGPDPMMNVYLVRDPASGFTLLHNGDNRCRDFVRPALVRAIAEGWNPTLFARTRPFPPSPKLELELWDILPELIIFPGHNYEFGHKGGHPRVPTHAEYIAGYFNSQEIGPQMAAGHFMTWSWGERFDWSTAK